MEIERELQERGVATAEFERELEALVLAAFASGAAVEGVWDVRTKPGPVPDWTIEITKGTASDQSDGVGDD